MFCNADSSSASVCVPSNFIYMNDPIWTQWDYSYAKSYFRGNSLFKIHKEDEVIKQVSVKAFLW